MNLCTEDDCQSCSSFLDPQSGLISRGCPGAAWKASGGAYGPACYAKVPTRKQPKDLDTRPSKKPEDKGPPGPSQNHPDAPRDQLAELPRNLQKVESQASPLPPSGQLDRQTTSEDELRPQSTGQSLALQGEVSGLQTVGRSATKDGFTGSPPEQSQVNGSATEKRETVYQLPKPEQSGGSDPAVRGTLPAEASHQQDPGAEEGADSRLPPSELQDSARAGDENPGTSPGGSSTRTGSFPGQVSEPETQEGVCFSYSDTVPPHLSICE